LEPVKTLGLAGREEAKVSGQEEKRKEIVVEFGGFCK
jgi:hypothetical protein